MKWDHDMIKGFFKKKKHKQKLQEYIKIVKKMQRNKWKRNHFIFLLLKVNISKNEYPV